jgi:hypothetical protein
MKMSTSLIRGADLPDQTSGFYWRRPLCWYSLAIFLSLVAPALRLTIFVRRSVPHRPAARHVRHVFRWSWPRAGMTALSSIGRWVSLVIGQTDTSHYQFWAQEQLLLRPGGKIALSGEIEAFS